MKSVVLGAIVSILSTLAAAASLTVSDGICDYRVAYDAAKVDGKRLKATFDYLANAMPAVEPAPEASTPEAVTAIDLGAYRARCAAHRQKLEALRLVALPGVEALRQREVSELDESCRTGEASLAAAKGDVGLMRAAAPACLRWADLLALPAPALKTRWNDLVVDLCTQSTERNICAGQLQRDGEGPGSEARRRNAVIVRWRECVAGTRPGRDDAADDRERSRLKALLAKRFRTRTLSCAR